MGIYVQSFADLPPGAPTQGWPAHVAECARKWAVARGLGDLFYATTSENGGTLTIHPAGGHVKFEIDSRRISLDAKTSVSGPGFHAALIGLADHLQQALELRWRWDAGGDETGFAIHRNRQELSASFAAQFVAYCDLYRRRKNSGDTFVLNLPTDLAFGRHAGVATPMGPYAIDHFIYDDASEDEARARTVFPWWDDDLDERFWKSTLRALLWSEVEWRAPRGQWEEFVAGATLAASTRATLDSDLQSAIVELRELQHDAKFTPPKNNGTGWRRRPRGYYLPGPWRIVMPGYYLDQIEDDGSTTCVWFGDEEVRGSSLTVTPKHPGELGWSRRFVEAPEHEGVRYKFRLAPIPSPSTTVSGFGVVWAEFQAFDEQGQGHVLTLSLFGPMTDALPARLKEVASSVFFDPPRPLPTTPSDA